MQKSKNNKILKIIKPAVTASFIACLSGVLFILLSGIKIQAQPDLEKKQQLLDLQKKLNELNSSLAKANNQKEKNTKKTATDIKGEKESNSNNNIKKNNNKNDTKKSESKSVKDNKDNTGEKVLKQKKKTPTSYKEKKTKSDVKKTKATDKKIDDKEYKKEKKRTDWIISTIDNGTHKDRKLALDRILLIKDSALKKQLEKKVIDIIKNEIDLEVKVKAITIAGELKSKDGVPNLTESLNSESNDVVIAAVYAIKKVGDQSTKPVLIKKLKEQKLDTNNNVIEALIDTLGEFKAVELVSFATNAIKDINTNRIVRELLVLFLGRLDSKEPQKILNEILVDEDESIQIRAYAANSLANLKIKEAGDDIEKVIKTIEGYPFNKKKKYYNLYIYCVAALAKLGDEKAIPRLINAMRSDNAVVRLKAIRLIKELKDKRTIDILKYKRDYDPSPKVQKAAKDALKELGVESDDSKESTDKGKKKGQ